MASTEFRRGERAACDKMHAWLLSMIEARLQWADSPEGRAELGPGSPTIPGLQDLYAMRDKVIALRVMAEVNT